MDIKHKRSPLTEFISYFHSELVQLLVVVALTKIELVSHILEIQICEFNLDKNLKHNFQNANQYSFFSNMNISFAPRLDRSNTLFYSIKRLKALCSSYYILLSRTLNYIKITMSLSNF